MSEYSPSGAGPTSHPVGICKTCGHTKPLLGDYCGTCTELVDVPISTRPGDVSLPALPDAARFGLVGEFLELVEEFSEACASSLYFDFMAQFGALVGPGPSKHLGPTRHSCRHYVWLLGTSAMARKGTSRGWVRHVFQKVDPKFLVENTCRGVSSGQGLVEIIRDPSKGEDENGKFVDLGSADHRCLVEITEGSMLTGAMSQSANIVATVLMDGWDKDEIRIPRRGDPVRSTLPHLCSVIHMTGEQFFYELPPVHFYSGLGNRICFNIAYPSGVENNYGYAPDEANVRVLASHVLSASQEAYKVGEMTWEDDGYWGEIAPALKAVRGVGPVQSLLGRAQDHVLRYAMNLSLQVGRKSIRRDALEAALAAWNVNEASCAYMFEKWNDSARATQMGADRALAGKAEEDTRKFLSLIPNIGDMVEGSLVQRAFNNNFHSKRRERIVGYLERTGMVRVHQLSGPGSPIRYERTG